MGLAAIVLAALSFSRHNNTKDPEKGIDRFAAQVAGDDAERDASGEDCEDVQHGRTSNAFRLRRLVLRSRAGSAAQHQPSPLLRFPRTNTTETTLSSGTTSIFGKAKEFIFPTEDPAALEKFVPNYRWTPIISGVVIPFSILLEIPGLTERWYIRTEGGETVETKPNPPILDCGLAFSIACALIANICLILRFLEKRVKTTTLLCIAFLTIHDIINIVAIAVFGVEHRFDDGFTYGQAYWMTVSSTAVSSVTNVTLIVDFIRTPDFGVSGSGLTRKQRSLVIIVIILLVYIALGALVSSFIQDLSFINGLYFIVVTIETIGFGDITPNTTGARIFTCVYMVFGILNIGLAVTMCRETVLEGLEIGYRRRLRRLRMRRREARRFRKWETRWRRAIEWRLRDKGLPVWVHDRYFAQEGIHFTGLGREHDGAGETQWMRRWFESIGLMKAERNSEERRHVRGHPKNKHLNIDALSSQQLEAAALEAGVPLEMFLESEGRHTTQHHASDASQAQGESNAGYSYGWPAHPQTPTHAQVGRMAAVITKFAVAVTGVIGHAAKETEHSDIGEQNASVTAAQDAEHVEKEIVAEANTEIKKGSTVWFHEDALNSKREYMSEAQIGGATGSEGVVDTSEQLDGETGHIGTSITTPEWARTVARVADDRSPFTYQRYREDMAAEEKKANLAKLVVAWSLFLLFWFVGSAIFSATEDWAYGTAMYFCFIAFTTTGYGDFAPVTPAGRSIFVVWALMGVATMTILISVVQEAGSSRYKSALHSRMFDNAIKEFRKRENEETNRIAHERLSPVLRYQAHHGLTSALGKDKELHEDGEVVTPGMVDAVREMAQLDLEKLPAEIIRQARTFQDHLRFFVNHVRRIGVGDSGEIGQESKTAPQELKDLLDEILNMEGIGARGKREILQDEEARNTLFMLSIERILRQMINAAEKSVAALAERDSLMAKQRESDRHREHVEEGAECSVTLDTRDENETQSNDPSSSSRASGSGDTTIIS